jgi:hypothetical protein
VAAVAALLLLVSGCGGRAGGDVVVEVPELTAGERRTCADLVAALPATVDGAQRRDVAPVDAPGAAWGDPPIVLRCGVTDPEGFDDFATCHQTNGVGWYVPEEQVTGFPEPVTMTTIGRDVNVEVSLPVEHFPPAAAMVDLAAAVKATTTLADPCV